MRKIEQQMLDAVRSRKTWQSGNTAVIADEDAGGCMVYLHGHVIASMNLPRDRDTSAPAYVTPRFDTFRRFPTATTRSRLRALGINASIRNGIAMINGKPA